MENNYAFKGVWIPKELWLSNDLTINEKILIAEIDALDSEDGCYASNKHFADFLQLSQSRISHIIASLKERGYIDVKIETFNGVVVKRILKINRPPAPPKNDDISQTQGYCENSKGYCENSKGYCENSKGGCENSKYRNTDIYTDSNTYIKENLIKEKRFKKPTLEEVQAYILEKGYSIDAQHFVDYYESNGWKVGRNPMKDWKACVRTWNTNNRQNKRKEFKSITNSYRNEVNKTVEETLAKGEIF